MSIMEAEPLAGQPQFNRANTTGESVWPLNQPYPYDTDSLIQSYSENPGVVNPPESRQKLDTYLELRDATKSLYKVDGEKLANIQSDVRAWLLDSYPDWEKPGSKEEYEISNPGAAFQKISALNVYLHEKHGSWIRGFELHTTEAFLEATAAMYEDHEKGGQLNDRDGSFGFLVPMRMSRKYPEYGQEIESLIPALRYVPNEMRAWIMRGLPPFIVDVYNRDEATGKRGYLVCIPSITEDMKDDLAQESMAMYITTAQAIVNQAVDFAVDRLGVQVIGLGATIPAITKYGQSITRPDVITTTGHGGTVEIICDIIDELSGDQAKDIGVIGLGAIGASAAEIAAERYPDRKIHIFDTVRKKAVNLLNKKPDNFEAAASISEIIARCNVLVSAVTQPIHLSKEDARNMKGTLLVDDSQPASINPEGIKKVEKAGGNVVWAIGNDATRNISRSGFDYGTMADGKTDLFGCEAEAAVLAHYLSELEANGRSSEFARKVVGRLAIDGPVTAYSAGMIGALFRRYGIGAAAPQAFGNHVELQLVSQ